MLTVNNLKVSEFRTFMTDQGKQKSTLESYTKDVQNFANFLSETNTPTGDIGPQVLEEYKNWLLNRGSKPSSIRRAVIAIRVFFRWLETSGQLHGNPMEDLPVPAHEQIAAREIPEEKITAMLAHAQLAPSSLKAARDTALILLLSREGLKASELVALKWSHFLCTGDSGRLAIIGDRSRTIALESRTTDALKAFRKIVQNDPRTKLMFAPTSPLFISFKGADARSLIWGITRHGLKFAIYELGDSTGIAKLNAEQLRHLAMAHKISLGFTPEMVMNHLGLRRIGNIGKHVAASVS
jgi:site-specific recombinase XerD